MTFDLATNDAGQECREPQADMAANPLGTPQTGAFATRLDITPWHTAEFAVPVVAAPGARQGRSRNVAASKRRQSADQFNKSRISRSCYSAICNP